MKDRKKSQRSSKWAIVPRFDIKNLRNFSLAFFAGYLSLSLEILGTNITFAFYPSSSEALALGLCSFLFGLSLGSWISQRFNVYLHRYFQETMALVFFIVAIIAGPVLSNFASIQMKLIEVSQHANWSAAFLHFGFGTLCFLYLFIPAVFLGLIFPLANDSALRLEALTGQVNLVDLIGAVTGALITGFILIPHLGLSRSFGLIAIVSLFLGLAFIIKLEKRFYVVALVCTLLVIPSIWKLRLIQNRFPTLPGHEVLFQEDSSFGTVSVVQVRNHYLADKLLLINYRFMCNSGFRLGETELAHLVLDDSREFETLNIGLGCGFTASAVREFNPSGNLDVVEINEKVAKGTASYFRKENNNVLEDPQTHLTISNGYDFMKLKSRQYDRILIDIGEPTIIQSSALFTEEGFALAKKRLNTGGIFGLWAFDQKETAKIILNTLRKVFKYAEIYPIIGPPPLPDSLLLYASDQPFPSWPKRSFAKIEEIESVPIQDIATVANNPYPKYFKFRELMNLPSDIREPLEIHSGETK